MPKKILYHGSGSIIEKPFFGGGNRNNDYGLGLYCTESLDLAKEWGATKEGGGYANEYELDTDGLDILTLSSGNYNILNWLTILLENRTFDLVTGFASEFRSYLFKEFMPPYKDADVIIGYRADDSYFSFAKAFLNGTLSLGQLSEAMHLGNLGEQIVLKSEKAFSALKFVRAIQVEDEKYYKSRIQRDHEARDKYRLEVASALQIKDAVFMIDIFRQQWKNDDPRLF